MRKAQRERLYRNVYRVFAGVLGVSALMMFFMTIAPFGLGFSWSGGDLVVTRATTLSEKGAVVGRGGVLAGQIELFTVGEVFRKDGELTYRAIPLTGGEALDVSAREARQSLVMSIPALGYWAYALSHPIGVLALIGIPLFTFALDVLVVAWAGSTRMRVRTFISGIRERRALRREEKELARARELELEEMEMERMEREREERAVKVAYRERESAPRPMPRTGPETYGMTIKLTRPQRYGMHMQ